MRNSAVPMIHSHSVIPPVSRNCVSLSIPCVKRSLGFIELFSFGFG